MSGCWEGPTEFSSQNIGNFLCYGNIPIVAKLESEIMLDDRISWWIRASLVHFPCRLSRRSYSGRTCFFPAKKPKMTAGRWCLKSLTNSQAATCHHLFVALGSTHHLPVGARASFRTHRAAWWGQPVVIQA